MQAQKIKKNRLWKNFLHFLKKSFSNISKIHPKKSSYIFVYFWEMEPSSCNIKKFIIFSYIYRNENPRKISYISGNGTFLYFRKRNPNKLIIFQEVTFWTFLYYLLAAQASSFLIHFLWLTGHHAIPEVTTLISFFLGLMVCHATPEVTNLTSYNLCDLWDTMPCQRSPLSFLTQLVPGEAEGFPRGGKYPKDLPLPTFLVYLRPV